MNPANMRLTYILSYPEALNPRTINLKSKLYGIKILDLGASVSADGQVPRTKGGTLNKDP